MKDAIAAGVFVIVFIFVVTTFYPSTAARELAQQEAFTTQEIERGLQRSLINKLIYWSSTFLSMGVLTWLIFSGRVRKITDWIQRKTGDRWYLTVLILGACFYFGIAILKFPFAVLRLEHLRYWGMTERSFLSWLTDYGKAVALELGIGAVVLLGFYGLQRWFPKTWWLWATGFGAVAGMLFAYILPIWISPMFNKFTPLKDEDLNQRILALAKKADVPVQGVWVMDASRQGNFENAYFTGFGSSQRIVLYDNLVKTHKDHPERLESILAHEIGHWKHNHILKGIALATAGTLIGLLLLHFFLRWAVQRKPFSLQSPGDPASWPLILLLMFLVDMTTAPVQNSISRHFEAQADMAALELARDADAFIAAEQELARKNKSNVAPNPVSVWWFATHPPTVERIRMAKSWQKEHASER